MPSIRQATTTGTLLDSDVVFAGVSTDEAGVDNYKDLICVGEQGFF